MAKKEPINWNKAAVENMKQTAGAGMVMGVMPGFANPIHAAIGATVGATIGAGVGVVQAYNAKKRAERDKSIRNHPALGRQWPKD